MSYRFSVAQLEQFVVSKKLSRSKANLLLAHHYPKVHAENLALIEQLRKDVREVKRVNHERENSDISSELLETLKACFKSKITLDTLLSEKLMDDEEFDAIVYQVEREYDIEFGEDEVESWVTIRDMSNAIFELTAD